MQPSTVVNSSTLSTPDTSSRNALSIGGLVASIMGGLGFVLLVFYVACTLWLAAKVPVSPQDLKDASWLLSYSATEFSATTIGVGMSVTCFVMGIVVGFVKNSPIPAFTGLAMCLVLHTSCMETTQLRAGVVSDSARIGCYVWESSECRAMLGVTVNDARSMYQSQAQMERTGEALAPWYQKALDAHVSWDAFTLIEPFSTVWAAFHTNELNAKLNAQRVAVTHFRKANHGSIAQQKQVDLSTFWH